MVVYCYHYCVYLSEGDYLSSSTIPYIKEQLLNTELHRADYKEYLELALLYLGEQPTRKKGSYVLRRPGADHHARWMSKAIYITNRE